MPSVSHMLLIRQKSFKRAIGLRHDRIETLKKGLEMGGSSTAFLHPRWTMDWLCSAEIIHPLEELLLRRQSAYTLTPFGARGMPRRSQEKIRQAG